MIQNTSNISSTFLDSNGRFNLYYLHQLYSHISNTVARRLFEEHYIDVTLTAGMWGGSYLVANDNGIARSNVVRLYSLVNLPQNSPLEDPQHFETLMILYEQTLRTTFAPYNLELQDPRWGEVIPYSNKQKPTTSLQMWDRSRRVNYMRVFFVWNSATWEESIIYDTIRNIKVVKELLDLNHRPPHKDMAEIKFLLQDVLIIYFTLHAALSEEFLEHGEPIVKELLKAFLNGIRDEEEAQEWYYKVYSSALIYGLEESLEKPYKDKGLNIQKVEEWPIDKINYVPPELLEKLGPPLKNQFMKFKKNMEKKNFPLN